MTPDEDVPRIKDEEGTWQGILLGISNVETIYYPEHGVLPLRNSSHTQHSTRTTLVVKDGKLEKTVTFEGIVLPDSIGHPVDIRKNDKEILSVYDLELGRMYSVRGR